MCPIQTFQTILKIQYRSSKRPKVVNHKNDVRSQKEKNILRKLVTCNNPWKFHHHSCLQFLVASQNRKPGDLTKKIRTTSSKGFTIEIPLVFIQWTLWLIHWNIGTSKSKALPLVASCSGFSPLRREKWRGSKKKSCETNNVWIYHHMPEDFQNQLMFTIPLTPKVCISRNACVPC